MIVEKLPSANDAQKYRIPHIWRGEAEEEIGQSMVNANADGDSAFMVTKVVLDPHAGEIAVGRLFSGTIKKGDQMYVAGMPYATLASPAGSVVADTLWNGPQGQLNKIGNSMGNLQDELFRRVVKYPEDLSPRQDCFFIQAYEYKPPYADAMGRQSNDGAAVGLSRSSPFKRKLGAGIKLPMPRNLPDQLSTNWQEDSVSTQAISAVQSSNKHYGLSLIHI